MAALGTWLQVIAVGLAVRLPWVCLQRAALSAAEVSLEPDVSAREPAELYFPDGHRCKQFGGKYAAAYWRQIL